MRRSHKIFFRENRLIYQNFDVPKLELNQSNEKGKPKPSEKLSLSKPINFIEQPEAVQYVRKESKKADDERRVAAMVFKDPAQEDDFERRAELYSPNIEADIMPAVHARLDSTGLIRQRLSGAFKLFEERLAVETYVLTDRNQQGQQKAALEKLSASLSVTDNISFFAEHWPGESGSSQYYGFNLNTPTRRYGDVDMSLSYSPQNRTVWIEGNIRNFNASTSLQIDPAENPANKANIGHIAVGYKSGSTKVNIYVDPVNKAVRFGAQMVF